MKNLPTGSPRVIRAVFESNEIVTKILSTFTKEGPEKYNKVVLHPSVPINPDSTFLIGNYSVPGDRDEQISLAEGIVEYLVPKNTPKITNIGFFGSKNGNPILNVQLDCPEATKQIHQTKELLSMSKEYRAM